MARRIPLPVFFDWMEYAKRKPFGEERADLRMGIMASALLNIQLAKGQRRTRPIDFMPFSKGTTARTKQTPAQMVAVLRGMAALHKQAGKARNSSKNAVKGPRTDDRGSDGVLDPENA
jgi:hypothetical protein